MQPVELRRDPAPSRWSYRFERLMLTPLFRLFLRIVVPFVVVAAGVLFWMSDQDRRDTITMAVNDLRRDIATRPEFMVSAMAIDGASNTIAEDIREIMPIDFPVSSFDLDLTALQARVSELPAVSSAAIRVRPGGILQLNVVERVPVLVWRTHRGLALVDKDGTVTGPAFTRSAHASLPLMAGKGAAQQVSEALELFAAARPLNNRLFGLVRVGQRRWNVVLNRGQRILLPEKGAVQALERVIALSKAQDMLERDLLVVDMRLSERPTIRLADSAVKEWWRTSQISLENLKQ